MKNEITISSLDDLQKRCLAPILARLEIDGQTIAVPVRRLLPFEEDKINAIRREVQPPLIKGRTPEEDRYNLADKTYQDKKDAAEQTVRAMTVYEGTPLIKEGKPGLEDRQQVLAYIQSMFTNTIMDILYLTIQGGGVKLAERVNFTSPADLES